MPDHVITRVHQLARKGRWLNRTDIIASQRTKEEQERNLVAHTPSDSDPDSDSDDSDYQPPRRTNDATDSDSDPDDSDDERNISDSDCS